MMHLSNLLLVATLISGYGACYAFNPRPLSSKSPFSIRGSTTQLFSSKDDENVVIVGGGVIGLSTALYLKKNDNNLNVTVLDKVSSTGPFTNGPVTAYSMGHVKPKFGIGFSEFKKKLCNECLDYQSEWLDDMEYSGTVDEQDCMVPSIALECVDTANDDEKADFYKFFLGDLKPTNLTIEEALEIEPLLGTDYENWLYFNDTARYDPDILLLSLRAACEKRGVALRLGEEWGVESLQINDDGDCTGVNLSGGEILGTVVVANGLGLETLVKDFTTVPVKPAETHWYKLRSPKKPFMSVRVSYTTNYIVSKPDGTVYVGDAGLDFVNVGESDGDATLANAKKLVPTIDTLDIEESMKAIRLMTADEFPIIGATKARNLYICGGFGGIGVTMAPYAARLVGHFILDNDTTDELSEVDKEVLEMCSCSRSCDMDEAFEKGGIVLGY